MPTAENIFVHISQVRRRRGEEPMPLPEGARVSFKIVNSPKGPQAADVEIVEERLNLPRQKADEAACAQVASRDQ